MKYYSEEETRDLRLAFEEEVLRWPHVRTKKMFGCPGYQVNGRLFAFLVTHGVVITHLTPADRVTLSRQHPTTVFQAGKKMVPNWVKLAIENKEDLDRILPFVRKSYGSTRRKA